ncbi:MAG: hypothetical protein PHI85_09070 [Victivallaceae bacterium]|nr:hypothetical protein [Victivallaceae bacterium]
MKINQILTVAGRPVEIVSIALTLDRDAPGRGVIVVKSDAPLDGDILVEAGINGTVSKYFAGYIESCRKIDPHQMRLAVREISGRLANRAPVALRNVTLRDAMAAVGAAVGLKLTAVGDWLDIPVPHFVNIGTGFEAVKLIGELSGLSGFRYTAFPAGFVFLGPAGQLKIAARPLELAARWFTNVTSVGADIAFIPALRPNMRLAIDGAPEAVISEVAMTAEALHLKFATGE